MAWPTSKPDSTAFDADSDRISTSRAELKTMSDAVNDIVDFVDTTGITNGQALVYDSVTDTIKPGDITLAQLQNNLDVNNFEITNSNTSSAGDGDITLRTGLLGGDIVLIGNEIRIGDSTGVGGTITTDYTTVDITIATKAGSFIRLEDVAGNNDIELKPTGSGKIFLDAPLKIQETSGAPGDTTTPSAWLKVETIATGDSAGAIADTYYIPLHQ